MKNCIIHYVIAVSFVAAVITLIVLAGCSLPPDIYVTPAHVEKAQNRCIMNGGFKSMYLAQVWNDREGREYQYRAKFSCGNGATFDEIWILK